MVFVIGMSKVDDLLDDSPVEIITAGNGCDETSAIGTQISSYTAP